MTNTYNDDTLDPKYWENRTKELKNRYHSQASASVAEIEKSLLGRNTTLWDMKEKEQLKDDDCYAPEPGDPAGHLKVCDSCNGLGQVSKVYNGHRRIDESCPKCCGEGVVKNGAWN